MQPSSARVESVDVAIVGAGPVGLFLARELVRRGHAVRLFEKHAGQSEHSKALAIMPRTMEVFELAKIVEPFEAAANRVTSARLVSHRRELGRIPFEPHESRYPYIAMVPQDLTERFLDEALVAAGGRVDYLTEVIGLERRADGVTLELARAGGVERCSARFVVGCDGAHSAIRTLAELAFEGAEYPQAFVLADLETSGEAPSDEMQLCPHEHGPLAIFPISATRRRLVATVEADDDTAPDLAAVNEILERRGPGDLHAEKLVWSSAFRIHHRQVTAMRAGPIFVAGDASHVHSPFGGQGMNTGLQDAWNLAWKLDFVLRGWATDALLESYSLERHPVARDVIRVTDTLTRTMSVANATAQTARDIALPLITRLQPFRDFFVSTLSELGLRLTDSPIVSGAGKRAPDVPVATESGVMRLYERLDGRYLLVYPQATANEGAALFDAVVVRYGGAAQALSSRGEDERYVRLIRPDSYIAWEASLELKDFPEAIGEIVAVLDTHLVRAPAFAERG